MDKPSEKRTTVLRWHTRSELYDYFSKHFNLGKKKVDREIYAVMETFKPRKGKAIKTAELWQKVGMNLEEKNTASIEVKNIE
ncbi:MAG: hypothetical protein JXA18_08270 [Chitinispirillaceae bacterium]|nr:hypothetical protein [Chitinispirillaceae bacterium]